MLGGVGRDGDWGPGLVRSACLLTPSGSFPCETGASSRSGCPFSCLCCCFTTVGAMFTLALSPLTLKAGRHPGGGLGAPEGTGGSAPCSPRDIAPGRGGRLQLSRCLEVKTRKGRRHRLGTWLRVAAALSAPRALLQKASASRAAALGLPGHGEERLAGADGTRYSFLEQSVHWLFGFLKNKTAFSSLPSPWLWPGGKRS